MDDLLSEFLTETKESLESLDTELVKLEQHPDDPELLGNIFRLVHTIKGTCGFLRLPRLELVAHSAENVLGNFRDGILVATPDAVSVILEALDRIKDLIATLEATEHEPEGQDSELIERLDETNLSAKHGMSPTAGERGRDAGPDAAPKQSPESSGTKPSTDQSAYERLGGKSPIDTAAGPVPESVQPPEADLVEAAATSVVSAANQSIRVNVDLLQGLMNMVSELVLTRNQLLQMVRAFEDTKFKVPLQRLSHVTTDLQERVMKTRMQPIGNAWAKLPRIVRDISRELDKKIDLEMLGAGTELDRQVLEMIKDPLTHMIRNSGDHGVETPAGRIAAGKPETGRIILNAYHEGGHVIIEISDDGKGIDVRKVKRKAISNGLASHAELDVMPDEQIMQFIFKAGFSTAEKVTSVSGRGVGMDVVRTNIEKLGGTIALKSAPGKGSKFTIKIPLTLAIVSALIVECAGVRFAIPQPNIVELVRVSSGSDHRMERIKDTPVLRLRNRFLPLISLVDLLQLNGAERPPAPERLDLQPALPALKAADGSADKSEPDLEMGEVIPISDATNRGSDEILIVVAQIADYRFGIIVDSVFHTEEIVVKPVAPILRDIQIYSGNTILGDGSVIMILDPKGIATATGEISVIAQTPTPNDAGADSTQREKSAILLFRAEGHEPKAVPLSLVARLEEIDPADIEISDGGPVVQYRGQVMPLLGVVPTFSVSEEGRQPVIVFAERNRSMGLVVDEIIDIVEDNLKIDVVSETEGLLGSAVIAGKATDVIDASFYISQAYGTQPGDGPEMIRGGGRRLLLVDDSAYFRSLLTPLLTGAGYRVTCVESVDAALGLREAGKKFDAIISDVEMPGMDGFEFAAEIRSGGTWRDLPLVALSSHTTPKDVERGRKAGFSDYVDKLDREALLETLAQTVSALRGAA